MVGRRLGRDFDVVDSLDSVPDHALIETIGIPVHKAEPWTLIGRRFLLAFVVLAAVTMLVYFGRAGYQDTVDPGGELSFLDALYYVTVSLTTTGYGDITPVTPEARLVNVIVVTPMRIFFLILLVGTTLSVLTEQSRKVLRIQRWRQQLRDHTIVIGYGTKGRSAVAAMLADDVQAKDIVVVDTDKLALRSAENSHIVTVHGSATRSDILKLAGVTRARSVVVATDSDDTSVLVTLSSRELAPRARIIATVREAENAHLLKQSGADQVVVSAETAGRLLGLATVTPTVVGMMEDLLSPAEGFNVAERQVTDGEVGSSPRDMSDLVLGVVRRGELLKVNDRSAEKVEKGDRLLYIRMGGPTG